MTNELEAVLARFEGVLTAAGAAVVPLLRPGIQEAEVSVRLGEIDLDSTSELITWFRWHDGAGEMGSVPARAIEIVPGGEFYWLDYLCREYAMIRETSAQLVSDPRVPFAEEEVWRSTWFPLLRLFGKGALAVDLDGDLGDGTPVHVVWWDSDPIQKSIQKWSSIAAFVETAIQRFTDETIVTNDDGYLEGPDVDQLIG